MKLTDLDPRWCLDADIIVGGINVHNETRHGMGLSFDCPCCGGKTRLAVWLANPIDGGPATDDAHNLWTRIGDSFETLTLTPSVDASKRLNMNRLIHILAIAITAAMLIPFVVGCQPTNRVGVIATAAGEATGALHAAIGDVRAAEVALPPVAATSKVRLESALESLGQVDKQMATFAQAARDLKNEQDTHASDLKRDKWIGWRTRQICYWLIGIAAGLFVLQVVLMVFYHFSLLGGLSSAASVVISALGVIPNFLNPIMAWLHQHLDKQQKVQTAVTNTLALPPGTLTAPPTPDQLKTLAKPKRKGDPPLATKLGAIPPVIGSTVPPVV